MTFAASRRSALAHLDGLRAAIDSFETEIPDYRAVGGGAGPAPERWAATIDRRQRRAARRTPSTWPPSSSAAIAASVSRSAPSPCTSTERR